MVALKILPNSLAETREVGLLAKLARPDVVGIFDFGTSGGYFSLLMELVNGNAGSILATCRCRRARRFRECHSGPPSIGGPCRIGEGFGHHPETQILGLANRGGSGDYSHPRFFSESPTE